MKYEVVGRFGGVDTFPVNALGPIRDRWGTGRLHSLCAGGSVGGIGNRPSSSLDGKGEGEGGPRLYHTGSRRGLGCGAHLRR